MATAAVGGMLASAVIKVVIKQIGSAIGGEIKQHWNMKKDLEKMKMTLESVEAVLSDAETRSVTDNSALLWLKRLKDAMYDISDMLDDFEADTDLIGARFFKQTNRATWFIMHDLVHDLARSVMADEYNLDGPNCRYAYLTDCDSCSNIYLLKHAIHVELEISQP
ncbi:uncharacterized protein LOC124696848 [Lolium rigidum]|uniref:uncharacterized protein LOC124696848 n=1 Tax=Lolium rigidum TaxID=89674 RepID=UPI001F5DDDC0|nr:uncharacterized protein LOC124696848 [Lolium rigidum]